MELRKIAWPASESETRRQVTIPLTMIGQFAFELAYKRRSNKSCPNRRTTRLASRPGLNIRTNSPCPAVHIAGISFLLPRAYPIISQSPGDVWPFAHKLAPRLPHA